MVLRLPRHVFHVAFSQHGSTGGIGVTSYEKVKRGTRGRSIDGWSETVKNCDPAALFTRSVAAALERARAESYVVVEVASSDRRIRALRRLRDTEEVPAWPGASDLASLASRFESVHFRYKPRAKLFEARRLARQAAGVPPRRKAVPEPLAWWEIGVELEIARFAQLAAEGDLDDEGLRWRAMQDE